MRALGYPCRALLTEWIDELHPEVRYRMVGRAPNILHTEALTNAVVIELCTRKPAHKKSPRSWPCVVLRGTTGKTNYSVVRHPHP